MILSFSLQYCTTVMVVEFSSSLLAHFVHIIFNINHVVMQPMHMGGVV